jgi:hypothetical protein
LIVWTEERDFFERNLLAFCGIESDLVDWLHKHVNHLKFTETVVLNGVNVPMKSLQIHFTENQNGGSRLKAIHMKCDFSQEDYEFDLVTQYKSLALLCDSYSLQELTLSISYDHLSPIGKNLQFLMDSISKCSNLALFSISISCMDEAIFLRPDPSHLKNVFEKLVSSLPENAPLRRIELLNNNYAFKCIFQGCISSLARYRNTLNSLALHSMGFDVNELVQLSESVPLKLLKFDNCETKQNITGLFGKITENLSNSLQDLTFGFRENLLLNRLSSNLKQLEFIEIKVPFVDFEKTLKLIFDCSSLHSIQHCSD